jgi:hypothetical protein
MKHFVNILREFSSAQRLVVLILLLSFTTFGAITMQYLRTDDCRPLREENLQMQEDFIRISRILRNAEPYLIEERVIEGKAPNLDTITLAPMTQMMMDEIGDVVRPYCDSTNQ